MTEYLLGPDGRPVGPEVDALTGVQRDAIMACGDFLRANIERIDHFKRRVAELGRSGKDTIITLIDVDDPTGHGKLFADMLMPDHNWQQFRDKGETPVARGLANKDGFPDILSELGFDEAARALITTEDLQVMVVHAGAIQIIDANYQYITT